MSTTVQAQNIAPYTVPAASSAKGTLGKDDFLKLLIQQLKNQDPLSPMNGTDFAAQLAQFSSLEQLSNINTNLEASINANGVLSQSISNALAATMIGKNVRASGNGFNYSGTGDVKLGYTLPQAADSASVKIYDGSGTLVRTIQGTGVDKGDESLSWDGKNDQGQTVAPGKYTFKVAAADTSGAAIQASPFMFGTVTAVRYKADGTYFVVDGVEIPLSDILEINNG